MFHSKEFQSISKPIEKKEFLEELIYGTIHFHFIWNFTKEIVCRLLLLNCDTKCEVLCCQDFWASTSKFKQRSKYLSNWFHRTKLKQKKPPQHNFCICIPQTRNDTSTQVQCLRANHSQFMWCHSNIHTPKKCLVLANFT